LFTSGQSKDELLAEMRAGLEEQRRVKSRGQRANALLQQRSKRRAQDPERLKKLFRRWSIGLLPIWGVYFIQAGEDGPVKIGVARDIRSRRTDSQIAHYQVLHIRGCIRERRSPELAEEALHKHFAQHRIRGEWFAPVEEITSLWKGDS
jgi:hypothetical protein